MANTEYGSADVAKKLDAIKALHDLAVQGLAHEVRANLVIPACRMVKRKFMSGNGTYGFFTKQGLIGRDILSPASLEDIRLKPEHKGFLREVFAALDMEISPNNYLGYHVDDYDPAKG